MTSALVTGATGFLGRAAALRLREMGWRVTGAGRDREAGRELEAQGVAFVRADLRNRSEMADACAGMDYVVHCGAMSSPWGRYRDFYETNVAGTEHVVAGCLRHGVRRLVHVSTPSVYFDYTHRLLLSERTPLPRRPANAYAATKRIAERVIGEAAASAALQTVILRPRAIFGPGDSSLFPRLMRVNETRGIPLVGGGEALLDLTYADNAVDALVLACQAPDAASGRVFNISGGEPVSLIGLLTRLFALLDMPLRTRPMSRPLALAAGSALEWAYRAMPLPGGEPPFTRYTVGLLAYSQTLDIAEARRTLGYEPRVGVDEGLRRFAHWWRERR